MHWLWGEAVRSWLGPILQPCFQYHESLLQVMFKMLRAPLRWKS